jgi:ankyrin repeat protein
MRFRSILLFSLASLLPAPARAAGWESVDWRKATAPRVKALLANTSRSAWEHVPVSRSNDPGRHFPPGDASALLLAATYSSRPEVVQDMLDAGGRADGTGPDAPLLYAARFNPEPRIIKVLVAGGARVKADLGYPILARPALTYAAQSNPSVAVIDELLEDGAAINAKVSVLDNMGFTSLMYAAQCNRNPEVVRELVRRGAGIELADAMSRTPLVFAAQYNENPKVLEALLAAGAKVNFSCRDYSKVGWTPLMFAAASSASPLPKVAALLAAGADAKARCQEGKTALDLANANARIKHGSPAYRALLKASD